MLTVSIELLGLTALAPLGPSGPERTLGRHKVAPRGRHVSPRSAKGCTRSPISLLVERGSSSPQADWRQSPELFGAWKGVSGWRGGSSWTSPYWREKSLSSSELDDATFWCLRFRCEPRREPTTFAFELFGVRRWSAGGKRRGELTFTQVASAPRALRSLKVCRRRATGSIELCYQPLRHLADELFGAPTREASEV